MAFTGLTRMAGRGDLGHAWPDFIVLGAMKAGTTTLFGALVRHPRVVRSRRREIHYFGSRYARGEAWYRRHFPTGLELRRHQAITGEGSTSYLAHQDAAARIRAAVPGVRMIALLRDPVDRAISNYFHERRTGRETRPIAEAFAGAEERPRDPKASPDGLDIFSYRRRGHYAAQLERYFALFPREQLLVIRSERFFAAPAGVVWEVCNFLGISPDDAPAEFRPLNLGGYDPGEVPGALLDELARYYLPHNQRLYQLLREDWGWRRPG